MEHFIQTKDITYDFPICRCSFKQTKNKSIFCSKQKPPPKPCSPSMITAGPWLLLISSVEKYIRYIFWYLPQAELLEFGEPVNPRTVAMALLLCTSIIQSEYERNETHGIFICMFMYPPLLPHCSYSSVDCIRCTNTRSSIPPGDCLYRTPNHHDSISDR